MTNTCTCLARPKMRLCIQLQVDSPNIFCYFPETKVNDWRIYDLSDLEISSSHSKIKTCLFRPEVSLYIWSFKLTANRLFKLMPRNWPMTLSPHDLMSLFTLEIQDGCSKSIDVLPDLKWFDVEFFELNTHTHTRARARACRHTSNSHLLLQCRRGSPVIDNFQLISSMMQTTEHRQIIIMSLQLSFHSCLGYSKVVT